jgi:thymidylate kinase
MIYRGLFVIEGNDHSGKSTLAQHLAERLDYICFDMSKHLNYSIRQYHDWEKLAEAIVATQYALFKTKALYNVVFQRFYPTRTVYNRARVALGMIPFEIITMKPKELPPHTIIWVDTSLETLNRRKVKLNPVASYVAECRLFEEYFNELKNNLNVNILRFDNNEDLETKEQLVEKFDKWCFQNDVLEEWAVK